MKLIIRILRLWQEQGYSIWLRLSAFGPAAAMAIATTFGTASTGTAIADTLFGAAATNAALAWLGGGAYCWRWRYWYMAAHY